MNSLDPRVARLPEAGEANGVSPKAPLDQFGTFEVFVQPKEEKPFQHEGIVHAPGLELAFVLAKEAFTRRFLCTSLSVAETRDVFVSPLTDGDQNVYDLLEEPHTDQLEKVDFEIYQLAKRGKQHVHAGTVKAATPAEAMWLAGKQFRQDKTVYNVWAIRASSLRWTGSDENDLWVTLPEKKFRDAGDYKGGEKLKQYLEHVKN